MELRDIEAKRQKLHLEIAALNQRNEEVKSEISHQQMELERLKISVQQVGHFYGCFTWFLFLIIILKIINISNAVSQEIIPIL